MAYFGASLLLLVRLHDQSSSSDEVGGLLQVLHAPFGVSIPKRIFSNP